MKKSIRILSGLAVAIAVATTAGAWYTGKQLPAELERSIAGVNQDMRRALVGVGGSVTFELASLDQHFFTSTAHYRVKVDDIPLQDGQTLDFEVGVIDQIEHGPFPWSRVKAFKLLPVLATSNSALEKDDTTAAWFEATGGQAPLSAQTSLGFDGSVDSDMQVAPVSIQDDTGTRIEFSGMHLQASEDREGASTFKGGADSFVFKLVGADHPPATLELKGLKVDGKLATTQYDAVYVGNVDLHLGEAKATLGPKQQVLLLKGLEQNASQAFDGAETLGGRVDYKIADISWDDHAVGSMQMGVSLQSLNAPALQALSQWYQVHQHEFEQAAAAGQPFPEIDMGAEEKARFHSDLHKLLAAKPKMAIDNFSLKTANGESRFNLGMDFVSPTSFDLPADQLAKQLITQVKSQLTLSKPMIGDLATLRALVQGQRDAQTIAQQAGQAGEMVGMLAVQSGMATVQGSDVVSSLHYADGMVDFNGKKMTLDEFVALLNAHVAALQPQG